MLVKKIMWMMLSAMTMSVVMVVSITAWTAQKNNQTAADDSLLMVRGGFEAVVERFALLNSDYSFWTAAMDAALRRDVEWLHENMGSGADSDNFETLEIFFPQDWTSFSWDHAAAQSGRGRINTPIVPVEIAQRTHAAFLELDIEQQSTTFIHEMDGEHHIIAVTRLQPWAAAAPLPASELPLNVMSYRLNEETLAELASTFLINDLVIAPGPVVPEWPSVPLISLDGDQIAHLEWTPPRPGDNLIRAAAAPLAISLALFLMLTGAVTVITTRNASELVVREKEASSAARTDAMTGLPNRVAFSESFTKLRQDGVEVAILFMDLNGFKAINDEYGHEIGDEILKQIARIARKYVRSQDMISRLGGDEFNVIFPGEDAEEVCIEFCERLAHRMARSVKVQSLVFHPRISMGYTTGRSQDTSVAELMRQADYAMYSAKLVKSTTPVKYDISLEEDKIREMQITSALEEALRRGDEISVAYQPIVDAKTGEMRLVEALVRWTSRTLGAVPPEAFISIAEKTGLIVDVGRVVIDTVFRDMRAYPNFNAGINLSPVQLRNSSILQDIEHMAKAHGVDKRRVTFEVTESMLVEDPDLTSFLLDNLSEQGYQLALDDFGVGYSSIGYLRKFRFDKLKIDKSFVDDIGMTENSENLMRALVYLARSLGMSIVAEGIETRAQSDALAAEDYDLLQGYYYSKPLPLEDLKRYIEDEAGRSSVVTRRARRI